MSVKLSFDPEDLMAAGDRSITDAKAEIQFMLNANPDLLAIHTMDAPGPDEDIM